MSPILALRSPFADLALWFQAHGPFVVTDAAVKEASARQRYAHGEARVGVTFVARRMF